MKGNPKSLNSRADYLYIKEHCEPNFWRPLWQNMLDMRYYWAPTDLLDKEEKCIVDKNHKFEKVLPAQGSGDPIMYQQYELKENPNCDMTRFGFTEREIQLALRS